MDVVYFVRRGANEELRFSLRSLAANLPHERVWIVGDKPPWVQGVQFVQGNRLGGSKWRNVYDNLRLAAEHVEADRFVVMNDDFHITHPTTAEALPTWHRCLLTAHIPKTSGHWRRSLESTLAFLIACGFEAPLSYELHLPVVMERAKLGEVLAEARHQTPLIPPQWRTLYGNWWHVPTTPAPADVKVGRRTVWQPGGFVSTSDMSWPASEAGRWVRKHFATAGPYEGRR